MLELITAAYLMALSAYATLLYLWGCNKGFDITDESIFFLQARKPKDVKCYPFFDFVYSSWLFRVSKENIVLHRMLLLAAAILSNLVFSFAIITVLRHYLADYQWSITDSVIITSFLYLSTLTRFCFGPRLLYYNHLNSFALLCSSGLFLIAHYHPQWAASPLKDYLFLLIGASIGFQFFIKISSCLAYLTAISFLELLFPGSPLLARFWNIAAILVGALAMVTFHFVFLQKPSAWWLAFSNQLKTAKLFAWGASCIPRHVREMREYLAQTIPVYTWALALPVAGGALVYLLASDKTDVRIASILIASAAWAHLLQQFIRNKNFSSAAYDPLRSPVTFTLLITASVLLLLIPISVVPASGIAGDIISPTFLAILITGLLLISLPFLGAIGTGNPIWVNTIFHLSAWAGLMLPPLFLLGDIWQVDALPSLFLGVVGTFFLLQFCHGFLFDQYRVRGGLPAQKWGTQIGAHGRTLLLDKETHDFFNKYRTSLEKNGFKPGDDIIGLFDIPGLVYAVGANSPGHQWYYTMASCPQGINEANYFHLSAVETKRLSRAFIVQKGAVDTFLPYLDRLGLGFPDSYAVLDRFILPLTDEQVTVYKPLSELRDTDAAALQLHIRRAMNHFKNNDLPATRNSLQSALALDPNSEDILTDLGNILFALGEVFEAEAKFRDAIRIAPQSVQARVGLATVFLHQGERDKAIEVTRESLRLDPSNAVANEVMKTLDAC